MAQVIGQRGDAGIATFDLVGHGATGNAVEVAAQRPGDRAGAVAAPRRAFGDVVGAARLRPECGIQVRHFDARFDVAAHRPRRARAGQQLHQQQTEQVNIGLGGDLAAFVLFRRGVVRSHDRHHAAGCRLAIGVDQFGDAEIEQFHLAVSGHEHVARLDVAMDHQVLVRVGHGVANLQHQVDTPGDRQLPLIAVIEQRRAVDQFQREPWTTIDGHAAIQQARDVRMHQPRQDLALTQEAAQDLVGIHAALDQLQRHWLPRQARLGFGAVDRTHAAAADALADAVASDQATRPRVVDFLLVQTAFQCAFRRFVGGQQRDHFSAQRGVVAALQLRPAAPLGFRLIQRRTGDRQCAAHEFGADRARIHRNIAVGRVH